MAIYAIGDTHLSFGTDKPMDVFGGEWQNYSEKLKNNWQQIIKRDDHVLIAGDISWAMNLSELYPDFEFLNNLNGKKYLIKGNHDYWFDTMKKINIFLSQNNFTSLKMIHNDCEIVENTAICGTRGWLFTGEQSTPQDKKIYQRELVRLEASLKAAVLKKAENIIVMLHYPPIYENNICNEFIKLISDYGVKTCVYGHLHAAALKYAFQGNVGGVEYKLVSSDYLDFSPIRIL